MAQYRESIRLAFVTALQHLPARQRASLILCEVLRWQVAEVAELLDTSVAAVNSALQRARATLRSVEPEGGIEPLDGPDAELLARYVDAFERYDIERTGHVAPRGRGAVDAAVRAVAAGRPSTSASGWSNPGPTGAADRGSLRPLPTDARPSASTGVTRPGGYMPWALQVLEISAGEIVGMSFFLDLLDHERLFPTFGLPLHLDG